MLFANLANLVPCAAALTFVNCIYALAQVADPMFYSRHVIGRLERSRCLNPI